MREHILRLFRNQSPIAADARLVELSSSISGDALTGNRITCVDVEMVNDTVHLLSGMAAHVMDRPFVNTVCIRLRCLQFHYRITSALHTCNNLRSLGVANNQHNPY